MARFSSTDPSSPGSSHRHYPVRRAGGVHPAGGTVPDIAPPSVSVRATTPARRPRPPRTRSLGHRAGDDRPDNLLYMSSSSAVGQRPGHSDLRFGHRSRCGPDAGPEQDAAGRIDAARCGAEYRRHRHQIFRQHVHGAGLHLRRRQHGRHGHRRLHGVHSADPISRSPASATCR